MRKEKRAKTSTHRATTTKVGFARRLVRSAFFGRSYMVFALLVLLATTLLWSYLGAKLQQGNADQLIDSYMFGSGAAFHGAQFPSTHSFLIKWPIFLLIKVFGSTPAAFIAFTAGIAVVTVAALAVIIYKIERRPLVFGTICLALASVLLAIPAQPYAGALLPVNMAMIATRNLEYIMYIVALALCVSAKRVRSWRFAAGAAVFVLLVASDKLFLTLGIGSAVIAYILYRPTLKVGLVRTSLKWLIGTVVGSVLAVGLLWVLNATHLTHLTNQGDTGGSYGIVHNVHDLALAVIYAVLGIFTNFDDKRRTAPRNNM